MNIVLYISMHDYYIIYIRTPNLRACTFVMSDLYYVLEIVAYFVGKVA